MNTPTSLRPVRVTSPSPDAAVIVHVFGRTDVGRMREHNEDAFVVADLSRGVATLQPEVRTHVVGERGSLFMVADGMGGAAAGEIASAMAIELILGHLTEFLATETPPSDAEFAQAIKRATAAANAEIYQFAVDHPEYRGMGTTATVAGILGSTLFVAQVGDSRAYLVRDGVARQITKDQSLMQKLIEAGEISEEEAELSERRNIILQALGPESAVKVDLTHQPVRQGDVLVLCSDGLSGQVRIDEIAAIVSQDPDLVTVCKRMIDRANENGGPDNITVIAARFEGAGLMSAADDDAVGHRVFPLTGDSGQMAAASMDSIGTRTTSEMPATPRRTTVPLPADAFVLTPSMPREDAARRRWRGSMFALVFVLLFLTIATWWAYRTAEEHLVPKARTTTAAPAAR